jgi:membrane protease subunit HflK
MVDQTEQAVVLRLGKFNRISEPGLHLKIPFGIERNFNVPTQVIQNMSFGFRAERPGVTTTYSRSDYPEESVMLTELNIVDVEWISSTDIDM